MLDQDTLLVNLLYVKSGLKPNINLEPETDGASIAVDIEYAAVDVAKATALGAICRQLNRKSKHQAERLILNLEDYPSSEVEGLIQKIIGKTNEAGDLKHIEELFIVKDGKITRIFLR